MGWTDSARLGRARRRTPALGFALGRACRNTLSCAVWLGLGAAAQAGGLPRVASTNLCTDQLVLGLADAAQIATVSWLAADPRESVMAAAAARHPLNYGTAEELLRFRPDVVVGGEFTRGFALGLLERLGIEVVTVPPADDVDAIARNLRAVGAAIGQRERAAHVTAAMRERERALAANAPAKRLGAIVVRPGGYTVGQGSLAHELMTLAGLANVAAEQGLDRWGSLPVEALLRSRPDLLVLVDYYRDSPSLANAVFAHRALRGLEHDVATVAIEAPPFACGMPQSLEAAGALQSAALAAVGR